MAAVTTIPLQLHVTEDGAPYTLLSTAYFPHGAGPFPMVVLNHGSPFHAQDAATQFARFGFQSAWFVEQGFAVVVPNRRGYGGSTGPVVERNSSCSHPDYAMTARRSSDDVIAAIDAMRGDARIDASRIVVGGVSAGGFASLATAARAPRGVVGAINFDGGRGSHGPGTQPCRPQQLIDVVGEFGATARVPTLWLYAENDHVFPPALARAMYSAYERGRNDAANQDRFVLLPASGDEGHYLFGTRASMGLWTPYVGAFLTRVTPA